MLRAPARYSGTLREFVREFVEPNLLSPELVSYYHRMLAEYSGGADPLYLVRQVRGTERRNVYQTKDGTRFKATDNAPSWWMHHLLFHQRRLMPERFATAVANAPAHLFDVSAAVPASISEHGWHVAHIFPVKTGDTDYARWRRSDVRARFLRNIHPCNYFFIAKTDWQLWGGNERVIGFFASYFAQRYSDVWEEFVELTKSDAGTLVKVAGEIEYTYDDKPSASRRGTSTSTPVVPAVREADLGAPVVVYEASRLLFKASVIEPLSATQRFRVVTPVGAFELSKADFQRAFPNVVISKSYREHGVYHYPTVPRAAMEFMVSRPTSEPDRD